MHVILTPEEDKLYINCIQAYGIDAQLEQYAEECLEAALAVRKYLRAKKSKDHKKLISTSEELCGEIIDTMNMSIQMKLAMMDYNSFNEIWNFKINRQINRVNKILNPISETNE